MQRTLIFNVLTFWFRKLSWTKRLVYCVS